MASLQSSFTVLATKPTPNPRLSQLRARRSMVSCSTSNGGRVDRRNMLLGLGGLYGASSLVPGRTARADPLLPPDLSTCDPEGAYIPERLNPDGTVNTPAIQLDVNCCPPYTDTITDYELPLFSQPRTRPAAHRMTPEYLEKYEEAIRRMKQLDEDDPNDPRGFTQQANIHCAYCNGPYDQVGHPGVDIQVHNSWIFFPFHRWYLYFFERICGELIGDPTFALPYWNWDHPDGMHLPAPFSVGYSPLYDCNRDQRHFGNAIVSLLPGRPGAIETNLNQMKEEMINQSVSAITFMGKNYRAGDPPPGPARRGTSERGSHGGVHVWTGNPKNPFNENLGNFYSAGRDPIFYCHHANVDRMWTIWESLPADYIKAINDPDYLDAAFLFYDEKKNLVRVKVRDCVDYKALGYVYEYSDIKPWLNYTPPRREVPANVQELTKTAQAATQAFPSTVAETITVVVPKPAKGRADEVLVLESIVTDSTELIAFDIFVNDDKNSTDEAVSPEFAGSFSQVPHRSRTAETPSDLTIVLKELYKNINIADEDDFVVVTIIPRINGEAVTIGGIKIVPLAAAT
ncbi:polyphenol oxidase I, chloroplastic-like [Salvia hispanica]|uniref:polyphenol oxidase I, chloroplastic-like n=1 Tax=Salvia hispanica TaxID=49212 RepID=UPI0020099439|nr:polyphenol oxidase I, chloroplastic-like [Salvia hispanica]